MSHSQRTFPGARALGLTFLTAASALAQDPTTSQTEWRGRPFAPQPISRSSASVQNLDGRLLGVGSNYRAQFETDRVVFTPALGKHARRATPLEFALTKVGRDSDLATTRHAAAATRTHEGTTVRYVRTGYEEVYDVRADGLKQSFVFHRLPSGAGDLVVRGALATEMALTHAGGDEIGFDADGLGQVRIDTVVGFDAVGRRVEGTLAVVNGSLEMRLPATFVDDATLPLTLDPLLTYFGVSAVQDEEDPDIACNPGLGRSLAVWERYYSSTDVDVMGRLINPDGTMYASTFFVRPIIGATAYDPHVAFVELNDHFVVIWSEALEIWARGVHSGTGALTPIVQVTSNTDVEINLDIGGDISGIDNDAAAVWQNLTTGQIEGAQIQVNIAGTLSTFTPKQISTPGSTWVDTTPRISKTEGGAGRYLVVWDRNFTGVNASQEGDIRAYIVDRNLVLIQLVVVTSGTDNDGDPDVDGDGSNWVIAWEREIDAFSGDKDILCASLTYDDVSGIAAFQGANQVVEGDFNDDEQNPAVCWLGGSALVGYIDEASGSNYDAYVKSVDPFTCTACEGEFPLEIGSWDTDNIAMTPMIGGLFASDPKALVLWDPQDPSSLDRSIQGNVFGADHGGTVEHFGGTCTGGGASFATCAVAGNSSFTMRVQRAEPGAPAYVLISPFAAEFWTFGCRLLPDLFTGSFIANGPTNSLGDSRLTLSLPSSSSLVGISFWAQWLIDTSAGLGTSSTLRITIE